MPKKIEEVTEVVEAVEAVEADAVEVTETAEVVEEPTIEAVEEVVAEVVETPSLGFLKSIQGKEVISVNFGEVYIDVKDVEGTTYKLPRAEYISLL